MIEITLAFFGFLFTLLIVLLWAAAVIVGVVILAHILTPVTGPFAWPISAALGLLTFLAGIGATRRDESSGSYGSSAESGGGWGASGGIGMSSDGGGSVGGMEGSGGYGGG
jgi:hypothetical protein